MVAGRPAEGLRCSLPAIRKTHHLGVYVHFGARNFVRVMRRDVSSPDRPGNNTRLSYTPIL